MSQQSICQNCGHQGRPVTVTKGTIGVEILAWLLFLIPGLFYSLWRLSTRYKACPACKAPNMVPLNTPRGKKLAKEFSC